MERLFNNRFTEGLSKITDVLLIGFYFLVCSLPVFTIGASATALYYAIHKSVFKGRGYTTEFFHSFKDNFKQSTLSWIVFVVLFLVLGGDIYITRTMLAADNPLAASSIFFTVLLIFTIAWTIYHFAYIARFENGFKDSFKVSAIIMFANLGWTFVLIGVVLFFVVLVYRFLVLLVFIPGLFTCAIHPLLERVFRKYMSEEDLMKEEE